MKPPKHKPCHFCGGKPQSQKAGSYAVYIRCPNCKCIGPQGNKTKKEAWAAWDKRY